MKKHSEKQLHPNEINSDSPENESVHYSSDTQATTLPSNESTEFVNSIQICQAVEQQKHEKHGKTDFDDSPIPAGETLPLPTAEEVNQALSNSDATNYDPDETQTFYPSKDAYLTEPINSYGSLNNPKEFNTFQFNEETETLPILNPSSSDTDTNYYHDENGRFDQIDYQNAGNVFDNPNSNDGYSSFRQQPAPYQTNSRSNSATDVKKTDNSLFLKRFIPIALMVFSAFASMGIIAHASLNQSYGGYGDPGYDMQQGPQGGMNNWNDKGGNNDQNQKGSDYNNGNGNAQTQSAIVLAENTTPSDNGSESDIGNSKNSSNPSGSNNRDNAYGGNNGDYSQGGKFGDGNMQGPSDGNMDYSHMGEGLTTLHVLALAFCAIVFACSLVYIIVTHFGTRPFALDKNTKMFSALGVAAIAIVMTSGLTASANALMSLTTARSGSNRYGDAGNKYDYDYYDRYGENYDDDYGYGYYYD